MDMDIVARVYVPPLLSRKQFANRAVVLILLSQFLQDVPLDNQQGKHTAGIDSSV